MSERRTFTRRRTVFGAIATFNRRLSTTDCTIRNLSEDGALLVFDNSALLPDEFDLSITRKEIALRVRTVWRNAGAAGVSFSGLRQPDTLPLDVSRKLKGAKSENDALKRRIADLSM